MTGYPEEPHETIPPSEPAHLGRTTRRLATPLLVVGALLVTASIAAVVAWALLGGGDKPKAKRAPASGLTESKLRSVARESGSAVYWAGPEPNTTYELSRTKDGRVFVRYLPPGARVGNSTPKYLTVATYPQKNAFATLQATAQKQGVQTFKVSGAGLAFQDKEHATSVYVAFRGTDAQIEVFDPDAARARRLVESGYIVPVAQAAASTAKRAAAKAATAAELKALSAKVGHPVYWAGRQPKTTYELTMTSDGRVYVRYLDPGVAVGSSRPDYLTVGTYPQKGALAILKRTAAKSNAKTFAVAGGGTAYVDPSRRTSVYVAFPRSDFQVEVYDPDAARAKRLVTSGQITPAR